MNIKTFSVEELAEGLACSPRWLIEQVRAGKFPARKIARNWRFTESDVAEIFALCANRFTKDASICTESADVVVLGAVRAAPLASCLTPASRKRFLGA